MKKRVIIASVLPKKRGEAMKKLLAILLGFSLAFQFSAVHAFAAKAKPDPKAVHPAEAAFTDEGQKEFCSFADDLLQFRSEAHILGFKPDRVYMAGLGYVLIEEFVGTNGVTPVAAGSQEREDNLTQGAPELRKVSYPNLWQGITLHYEAKQGGLTQSTYIVEPEADVSTIRLRYNGEAKIQKDGTLRFRHPTEKGYFTMTAPIAWQEISGEKVDVEVSFNEYEDNAIGFEVGRYDRQYPLIIDPTYVWHTFHGSSSSDWGYGIATDTGGNIYVTGYSNATWGSPVNAHAHSGNSDIVVMKLSTDGALQWNTFHGSMSDDIGLAIAADGNGGVYVAGSSDNTWGSPVNAHAHSGHPNIVVLKLDTDGALQWNTFHGSAWDSAFGIVTDMSGNVYVTGYSNATWGSPVNAHTGSADIVVMKLSTDGALQWNTFHGSSSSDGGYGIATDTHGNVYVTGYSEGTWGLPVNAHSGSADIVVLKLDTDGALQWNTFHGANSWDEGRGIAVTGGNVYVAGNSGFEWGSPVNAHTGSADIVVLKLDTDGVLQWNTFHGAGGSGDYSIGMAADMRGNTYVIGYSHSTWGLPVNAHSGSDDIVVLKLDTDGALQWNTFHGSSSSDGGYGIAVTGGNVYVTGYSNATWGSPVNAHSGSADIVVLKLSPVTFADVPPGFWAYDYIMAIYDAGITTGYPDGTYRPSQNVQRSQMAAFIIRATFGEDFSYSSTQHFSDIPDTHWAFKYVQKMYDEGITTGYVDGTYRPFQNVQRSQMASFIIKAMFPGGFLYTPTPYFSDVPADHWAFQYVQKMYDEGITTGYTDGTYRPSQNVSRAQMASFIARAFLGME